MAKVTGTVTIHFQPGQRQRLVHVLKHGIDLGEDIKKNAQWLLTKLEKVRGSSVTFRNSEIHRIIETADDIRDFAKEEVPGLIKMWMDKRGGTS